MVEAAVKNMDGQQTIIAILTVAAIVSSNWSFKLQLAAQSRRQKIEFDAKENAEETARYQMITDLVSEVIGLAKSKGAFEETNKKIIDKLEDNDSLILADGVSVTGLECKNIVKKKPDEPIEIRLDGEYRILTV